MLIRLCECTCCSAHLLSNVFKPSINFPIDRSKAVLLLWILFVICVSCLSVILSCIFLAGWEMADLLALLYVTFSCVLSLFHMVSLFCGSFLFRVCLSYCLVCSLQAGTGLTFRCFLVFLSLSHMISRVRCGT